MFRSALLIALVAACVSAAPADYLPRGWTDLETRPQADQALELILRLRDRVSTSELDDLLMKVSDPRSPDYGKYLSQQQLAELTEPSAESRRIVEAWLEENDLTYKLSGVNDRYIVSTTIAAAETLFSTKFTTIYNRETKQSTHRAGSMTVPAMIREHVSSVFGVRGVPLPPPVSQKKSVGFGPYSVTPAVIHSTYNVTNVTVNRDSTKNRQVLALWRAPLQSRWRSHVVVTHLN